MFQVRKNKPRIVMAGPLPPVVGGMATVIGDISRSRVNQEVQLTLFDTSKTTREGRPLWEGVRSKLQLWYRWWIVLGDKPADIAHIHTCSGLTFFLDAVLMFIANMRGVRSVLHVHGGKFDQFLDSISWMFRWLVNVVAGQAAQVVVLSDDWRDRLRVRMPSARLRVIRNGVFMPVRQSERPSSEDVTILFLGNLSQSKGVWDLLPVMVDLPQCSRLVLVGGEGEPGITQQIRQEIARLGLQDRVQIAGPALGDAKYDWLNNADIFVLPSYAEGLPVSMLEAMAAGLPVVVTRVGAVPSVIGDDQFGLLVDPGDRQALVAALTRLVGDPGLRATLGERGRTRCLKEYSLDRSAQEYLAMYHELLEGNTPVRSADP